jgi:hypothetical protein
LDARGYYGYATASSVHRCKGHIVWKDADRGEEAVDEFDAATVVQQIDPDTGHVVDRDIERPVLGLKDMGCQPCPPAQEG